MEELPGREEQLAVQGRERCRGNVGVLETGRRPSGGNMSFRSFATTVIDLPALRISDESHHQHVFSHFYWFWAADAGRLEPLQVAHLLLCPHANHLSGVVPAVNVEYKRRVRGSSAARVPVAFAETIFSRDIAVAVLEHQDGGLVDLQSQVPAFRVDGMVDVCLDERL